MLTERQRLRLEHIVENAGRIAGYVDGLSYEDFAASAMVLDAVERCLARITEAATRAGDEVMALVAPDVPPHVYRGFGNALRHDYDQLDMRTVWLTATKDMPLLGKACERALKDGN
jgi:uncharacterized protein with HEPN domain